MPLTLVPPRASSSNYRMRGTLKIGHLSKTIDESTGVPDEKRARRVLQAREEAIYRELLDPVVAGAAKPHSHSFEEAAVGYLEASHARSTQRDAVLCIR